MQLFFSLPINYFEHWALACNCLNSLKILYYSLVLKSMKITLFRFGIKCGSITTIQTHCIYIKIHFIYKNKNNTKQNKTIYFMSIANIILMVTKQAVDIFVQISGQQLYLSSGINVASSKIYHYKWHIWIIEYSWILCLGDKLDKYEILDWCPLSAILILGLL